MRIGYRFIIKEGRGENSFLYKTHKSPAYFRSALGAFEQCEIYMDKMRALNNETDIKKIIIKRGINWHA